MNEQSLVPTDPDFAALADEFGTPLYIYDGEALAAQYHTLRAEIDENLDFFFSLKSNPNLSVCALLRTLGAHAEVSSLAELRTALTAGVAPADILFLGPGKSRAELRTCLEEGIFAIVCESFGELALIDELARESRTTARVALRVNPAFTVKGSRLTMGGKPRQFGIDQEQVLARRGLAEEFPAVRLVGLQVYMGTRILDATVVAENTRHILGLADRAAERTGLPLEMVDIGGGLGVAYFEGESDLVPTMLGRLINPLIAAFRARHPSTRLVMELGRYLTATCGTYVTRVRYVKESGGERFAVTDGGTHHHMAAVGTGSYVKRNFPMRLLAPAGRGEPEPWNVTGPLCTPNDTLGRKVLLPPLRPGDLIGVLRSGAYGPSASPVHFLGHGAPAEVLLHEGGAFLVRERDRLEDLLGPQRLHPALCPAPRSRPDAGRLTPDRPSSR